MSNMPFGNVAAQLDFQLLLALDALLRHRHLTRAGDALGVTQPVMSKYLQRLRNLLQDPLFVRTSSAMVPTPRAEALVEPLAQMLELARTQLMLAPRFDPATSRREFSLLASDFGAMVLVPALLADLRSSAADIRLRIVSPDERFGERLESGEADLLIGIVDRLAEAISTRVLYEDSFTCLVRSKHPAAQTGLTLESYRNADHVVAGLESTHRNLVEATIRRHAPDARIALRLPSFSAVAGVIASSDLIITIPKRVAETISRTSDCIEVALPFAMPRVTVILAWHSRNDNEPGHRWLRNTIEQVLAETPMRRQRTPR